MRHKASIHKIIVSCNGMLCRLGFCFRDDPKFLKFFSLGYFDLKSTFFERLINKLNKYRGISEFYRIYRLRVFRAQHGHHMRMAALYGILQSLKYTIKIQDFSFVHIAHKWTDG